MSRAILFFCHGARDPAWRVPFDDIVARLRAARPGLDVELAFLELMEPTFDDAIARLVARGVAHVSVVPLFVAPGSHTRRDLPALVGAAHARWPALRIEVAPTLTESVAMREAIVADALARARREPPA